MQLGATVMRQFESDKHRRLGTWHAWLGISPLLHMHTDHKPEWRDVIKYDATSVVGLLGCHIEPNTCGVHSWWYAQSNEKGSCLCGPATDRISVHLSRVSRPRIRHFSPRGLDKSLDCLLIPDLNPLECPDKPLVSKAQLPKSYALSIPSTIPQIGLLEPDHT